MLTRSIRILVTSFLFITLLSSCATQVASIKEDKDLSLEVDEGYLLMAVETGPSLYKVLIGGEKRLELTGDDLQAGSNYIMLDLPAGKYYLSKVFLHRNLWYELEDGKWEFEVSPGEISYVGSLQVKTRVWGGYAEIELVNKSSMALEFLETSFPNVLASRSISYRGPGRDRFYELIQREEVEQLRKEQERELQGGANE